MYNTLISADDLNKSLDQTNLVLLDCRFFLADTNKGRKDYELIHIPNAQYVHLDEDLSGEIIKGKTGRHPFPNVEDFTEKLRNWGIDRDTQVIAYDQGHGGIAARLWFLTKWLGHEKVAVLDGGWKSWIENSYPTNSEIPIIHPKKYESNLKAELIVDVGFMVEHLKSEDYIYIDSRAAERYRGEKEPIDPVAGHIPGAISAPFLENLGEDGLFLPKEKLARRFLNKLKDQPKRKAIFYCGSGVTACHNLLALSHIGMNTLKLYPGSWSEWIIDENRGVEKV